MSKSKRTGQFKYLLGKLWMTLNGWTFEGALPPQGKFVLICAPHTSNWDLIYLLAIMFVHRIKVRWVGKHTIFKKPFGRIMKCLGGIPVDRRNAHGAVGQIADLFAKEDDLIIAMTPPGTRSKTDHWKSGFYHIAHQAQVPILLGFADYANKKAGTGPAFIPEGDIKKDMDMIRDFYRGIRGKCPEKETTIILREELE